MTGSPAIIARPCPNHSSRWGYPPTAVVLHIMEGTLAGCDSWFANPQSQVSAHYGVGKGGELHSYVGEGFAAWHAGVVDRPMWKQLPPWNPNLSTLGIEHEGYSGDAWTPEQIAVDVWLLRKFWRDYGLEPITSVSVVRHSAINASHAGCPGPGCPLEAIVAQARAAGSLGVSE